MCCNYSPQTKASGFGWRKPKLGLNNRHPSTEVALPAFSNLAGAWMCFPVPWFLRVQFGRCICGFTTILLNSLPRFKLGSLSEWWWDWDRLKDGWARWTGLVEESGPVLASILPSPGTSHPSSLMLMSTMPWIPWTGARLESKCCLCVRRTPDTCYHNMPGRIEGSRASLDAPATVKASQPRVNQVQISGALAGHLKPSHPLWFFFSCGIRTWWREFFFWSCHSRLQFALYH